MSQPISVSVQMNATSFHDFASFDLLRHHKRWRRPVLFTAILLISAGICLSQVGQREGAALLTVVLAIVALGVPAVYFWTFFHNLSIQIKNGSFPTKALLPSPAERRRAVGLDGRRTGQARADPSIPVAEHLHRLSCSGRDLCICPAESGVSAERIHRRSVGVHD